MTPSFLTRLWLAFVAPFRLLFDVRFATAVQQARLGLPSPAAATDASDDAKEPEEAPPKPEPRLSLASAAPDAALQLLGLLQREGRFVDFLMEDVAAFSDADIGAAARVVHEGCGRALKEHFSVAPVREEAEESEIEVPKGFNNRELRLTGNVVGDGPYRGSLAHRGWKVTDVRLPQLVEGHDATVIAAAEVELA